jgi:pyruvate kinase
MILSKDPKTKIVATMGPASADPTVLREMLLHGVDVCRLNFSHGSHEFHAATIATIRALNEELGLTTAILADLQGPKLRVGEMAHGPIELVPGAELVITTTGDKGVPGLVSTGYTQFPKDVKPGEMVLLDDGKLRLEVLSTNGKDRVITRVVAGGPLSSNKGINLPNTKVSLPCLTEKDRLDLDFALDQGVDWVGLSFVRSARDIIELKHLIQAGASGARVVAKIEKPEAMLRDRRDHPRERCLDGGPR